MTETSPTNTAYFAAGCFWGVEMAFSMTEGVTATEVGYMGGRTENPSYEDVCRTETGHAETVKVTFDPSRVTFEDLLKVFFGNHKPTQLNRQGPDIGTQYRSAIFPTDDAQREAAEVTIRAEDESGKWDKPVVTTIEPMAPFYRAEEYHQKYLEKRGKTSCGI
ncbi:MAG: peptide-methionine (S)-S-oxide reductase MsrA [Planctomycetota bacterium]